jgi:alginate O-acetyltransferase complex protein AlgI
MNSERLLSLLQYNRENPLLFNSGLFLFLFIGFLALYGFIYKKPSLRVLWVVVFSIYFYYKSSGWYFLVMLGTSFIAHYLCQYIYLSRNHFQRKSIFIFSLLLFLSLLGIFKYLDFFIGIWNSFYLKKIQAQNLFLPLGISFYTFELISYASDVYQRKFKPVKRLDDFLFYISFFPHLVAGPIVRPHELVPQIRGKIELLREWIGKGTFLIICGLVKKAIISDYIGVNFVDRVFDNPALYSGIENLLAVYGYTLQIYCDFSGYTDMAVGIALWMGFQLPVNFRTPYSSLSLTDFWKRWHISLSSWLRDYLYIPLGGNKKGKARTYFNLLITMLLGGLWHGASWKFVMWGGLHGSILALERMINKYFPKPVNSSAGKSLAWFYTFHVVAFCWIFFRATNFEQATLVIQQIACSFHPELLLTIVSAYPEVFIAIALGYLLHWSPQKLDNKIEDFFKKAPLILQAFLLALIIWLTFQTMSANVQPFIYFQF